MVILKNLLFDLLSQNEREREREIRRGELYFVFLKMGMG